MDFTTALTRLLSDPKLRQAFREDRAALAARLGLIEPDAAALVALDADDLDEQARMLIRKRFAEVARLLPETIHRLGAAAEQAFSDYAAAHWPTGHDRHPRDAAAFGLHLIRTGNVNACRAEIHRVAFASGRRRWAVHLVPVLTTRGRSRTVLQILHRRRDGSLRERWLHAW